MAETIQMDEIVATLEKILIGTKRKNEILRAALIQGEADERAIARALVLARNLETVTQELNLPDLGQLTE